MRTFDEEVDSVRTLERSSPAHFPGPVRADLSPGPPRHALSGIASAAQPYGLPHHAASSGATAQAVSRMYLDFVRQTEKRKLKQLRRKYMYERQKEKDDVDHEEHIPGFTNEHEHAESRIERASCFNDKFDGIAIQWHCHQACL